MFVSETPSSVLYDIVPGWLKKEREGEQLHQYCEQRRSGRRQMGIDISDVFGRRGSDDYADYTFDTNYFRDRNDGWGAASFKARKNNLLQYIELDPAELNSLMAQKESVYATGASQYLPRINKPFKEFGAIFRLEGVLVDITGLHQKVWNKVATEFDFKAPLEEDIRRAAVTRPDTVVREIVFRMNDIILERKVVQTYRRILREEFDAWTRAEGIVVQESTNDAATTTREKGSLSIGFDEPNPVPLVRPQPHSFADEAKRLQHLKVRWTKTAKQFGFEPPTNQQIVESALLTPDIVVRSIFGWSSDQRPMDQVVAAYSIMQAGSDFVWNEHWCTRQQYASTEWAARNYGGFFFGIAVHGVVKGCRGALFIST